MAIPDSLQQLRRKVDLIMEEWHLLQDPASADVEEFTVADAVLNLQNDLGECRRLLEVVEGLMPPTDQTTLGPTTHSDPSASHIPTALEGASPAEQEPPTAPEWFTSPSDLLQQGRITRAEMQSFLRVLTLSGGADQSEEIASRSEWPETPTKADWFRRHFVRRRLERRLRSADLAREGFLGFSVTVLPEAPPSRDAPPTELRVVPTEGETIEHLLDRGRREYELWSDQLQATDTPPGVRRTAELSRQFEWYWKYWEGNSVNQIAASSIAPDGRRYDRKTVSHGVDVVAGLLGQKRVRGRERFVPETAAGHRGPSTY